MIYFEPYDVVGFECKEFYEKFHNFLANASLTQVRNLIIADQNSSVSAFLDHPNCRYHPVEIEMTKTVATIVETNLNKQCEKDARVLTNRDAVIVEVAINPDSASGKQYRAIREDVRKGDMVVVDDTPVKMLYYVVKVYDEQPSADADLKWITSVVSTTYYDAIREEEKQLAEQFKAARKRKARSAELNELLDDPDLGDIAQSYLEYQSSVVEEYDNLDGFEHDVVSDNK